MDVIKYTRPRTLGDLVAFELDTNYCRESVTLLYGAGKVGKLLTARLVKNRLDTELVGNVSIKVLNTERPDTWEVQGRGELQLAVLVEMMRREGFELTVGKPQVLIREINGTIAPAKSGSRCIPRVGCKSTEPNQQW